MAAGQQWQDQLDALVRERNEQWQNEIRNDPVLGKDLKETRATIGRLISTLPQDMQPQFRKAMDDLGAGNNPIFARAMHFWASQFTEARHVNAGGPVKLNAQGQPDTSRPSLAKSIFPNLPG